MTSLRKSWRIAAIIVAATIGEGIFALPYIFKQAGWFIGVGYLVALSAVVIAAHLTYLSTLQKVGEKERLLGLARKYFGQVGFWVGFIAIIGGLLLALVAYLIIGPRFLILLFPSLTPAIALLLFWIAISIPVLVSNFRATKLEVIGVILVAIATIFVFANGISGFNPTILPIANAQNALLPFGIILLALAGWTGVEPLYELAKKTRAASKMVPAIVCGTLVAAGLYLLFVVGIAGSALHITSDTLSGLANWAIWKRFLITLLGLFAIGTGSVPLTHEIRNAFEKDLKWNKTLSCSIIIFAPIICVLAGLNNFVVVLSLAGGCFIALQYFLIVLVGRRALPLSLGEKISLDVIAIICAWAAVYQILTFVVR